MLERGTATLEALQVAIGEFVGGISHDDQDERIAQALPHALRVSQYASDIADRAAELARLQTQVRLEDPDLAAAYHHVRANAVALLDRSKVDDEDWRIDRLEDAREAFERDYQVLKAQVLRAGTLGTLPARRMAGALEVLSALHRIVDQATKAARYLHRFVTYRSETDQSREAPNDTVADAAATRDAETRQTRTDRENS